MRQSVFGEPGVGWTGIVLHGRRASVVSFSRIAGQEARRRSVASCQGQEHTAPCLEPGRAPNAGADRSWVNGERKGKQWGGGSRLEACAYI